MIALNFVFFLIKIKIYYMKNLIKRFYKKYLNKGNIEKAGTKVSRKLYIFFVVSLAAGLSVATLYFFVKYMPVSDVRSKFQNHVKRITIFREILKNYKKSGKDVIPTELVINQINGLAAEALEELKAADENSSRSVRLLLALLYSIIALLLGLLGIRLSKTLMKKLINVLRTRRMTSISAAELRLIVQEVKGQNHVQVPVQVEA